MEYVHGKLLGLDNGTITITILCLMVGSIAGWYRDVIAMLTVYNLNAKMQTDLWTKNIEISEEIGFGLVITLTDGNEVNHKFFKNIVGDNILQDYIRNPFNFSRYMFIAFDPVHLFECFYTNFLIKKRFVFPDLEYHDKLLEARFVDIQPLYQMELSKLSPTNIEKTNVLLADSLFHESTIDALRYNRGRVR